MKQKIFLSLLANLLPYLLLADGSVDITSMLVNPSFENGRDGWTENGTAVYSGIGGSNDNKCIEVWTNSYFDFDIYQELENIPEGVYELEVQGFYRYGGHTSNAWNHYLSQDVEYVRPGGSPVFFYINDNYKPFLNIFGDERQITDVSLYEGTDYVSNTKDGSTYYYYPNGMRSAAVAFSAGLYNMSMKCFVNSGKLRIGVKGTGSEWACWDNVRLIYYGSDIDIQVYPIEIDGIFYKLHKNTLHAEVTNNPNKYSGSINIPKTVKYDGLTYNVTSIGEKAFYNSGIKSVTIPSSVTSIGSMAFFSCKDLKEVYSLIEEPFAIDKNVFQYYNNNNSLMFTSATLYVPVGKKSAYKSTDGWKNFGENIVEMGGVVAGSIIFADEAVKAVCVEHWDANGDGELTEEEAAAVTDLGEVFKDNRDIDSFDELAYFTGLTSISPNAFYGSSLSSVVIPKNVTSIGVGAFDQCDYLGNITVSSETPFSISDNSFYEGNYTNSILYVPENTVATFQSTNVWNKFVNTESVTTKDNEGTGHTFTDKINRTIKKNKNIMMTFKVTGSGCQIGNGENASVHGAEVVRVYETAGKKKFSVTAVGRRGFAFLSGLKICYLPKTVTRIGEEAFLGCSAMTTFDLPRKVEYISDNAFEKNITLRVSPITNLDVIPPIYKKEIRSRYDKDDDDEDEDDEEEEEELLDLKHVYIPTNIVSIGSRAYSYCSSVVKMVVAEDHGTYDSRNECNAINSGSTLLFGCQNTVIPGGISAIGAYAFEGHKHLKTINFPGSVRSIGDYAFKDTGLRIIYSNITDPQPFNDNAFDESTYSSATLSIPAGTLEKYQTTAGWKNFFNIVEREETDVTIMVKSCAREYGDNNPDFEYEVLSGTITSGEPRFRCTATAKSPVGTYDVIMDKGTISNTNVTIIDGTMTILPAVVTVSAGDHSMAEGKELPKITLKYEGFKNNETYTALTTLPVITTWATKESPAGKYPLYVSGAEADNYIFKYVDGELTILANVPYVWYYSTVSDGKLTFCCDAEREKRDGPTYELNKENELPGWYEHNNHVFRVVFDESFADVRPETTYAWFKGCEFLGRVSLPSFITKIDESMFEGCKVLSSIGDEVEIEEIGKSAFKGCTNLKTLPCVTDKPVKVSDYAFDGCLSLNFDTPYTFTFKHTQEESEENEEAITEGKYAFRGCQNLETIRLYAEEIPEGAFYECKNLTDVIFVNRFLEEDPVYYSMNGIKVGDGAFYNCKSLYRFEASVCVAGERAFYQCESLPSVMLVNNNNVNNTWDEINIGKEAFWLCETLDRVSIYSSQPGITLGYRALFNGIDYPEEYLNKKYNRMNGVYVFGNDDFHQNINTIPSSAFYHHYFSGNYFPSLYVMTNSENKDAIYSKYKNTSGWKSFHNHVKGHTDIDCPYQIDYPYQNDHIVGYTRENVSKLVNASFAKEIPYNNECVYPIPKELNGYKISVIGEKAFKDNYMIQAVRIPYTIGEIQGSAFRNTPNLKSLYVEWKEPLNLIWIYKWLKVSKASPMYGVDFNKCTLYVPRGCGDSYRKHPVWGSFKHIVETSKEGHSTRPPRNDNSKTDVIDYWYNEIIDFWDLTTKRICIENWDTNNSGELSKGEASRVNDLGTVFQGTEICSFREMEYFTGLTTLPDSAFAYCEYLDSIAIPKNVSSFGEGAFAECDNLDYLESFVEQPFPFDDGVFTQSAYDSTLLVVPNGKKQLYEQTDGWKNFFAIVEKDDAIKFKGDLTNDMQVDGMDLVALVNIMFSGYPSTKADLNNDGEVDGLDYVTIVNLILNAAFSRSADVAVARRSGNIPHHINIDVEPFDIAAGESREMTITLQNPDMAVTMVQMDMTLPKGLTLGSNYTLERTDKESHLLYMGGSDTQKRLILASGKNNTLTGNDGSIIHLTLTADETFKSGDIQFSNILCATPDLQAARQPSFKVSLGGVTDINAFSDNGNDSQQEVYNLSGQRLTVPHKGVNVVNGKKITTK